MTQYTVNEFAEKKNVQPGTIYNAIRNGTVIAEGSPKIIDDKHPINQQYLFKSRKDHNSLSAILKQKSGKEKNFAEYLAYCDECNLTGEEPLNFDEWKIIDESDDTNADLELLNQKATWEFEKTKAQVILTKNRSAAIAFNRAKELGLVVDIKTIQQKMQALAVTFADLLTLADTMSEELVDLVLSSESPAIDVRRRLREEFIKLIQKVKQVTDETTNTEQDIQYILTDISQDD